VIAIACSTEPVSTPRRTLALLNAKVAADSRAINPPSTPAFSLTIFLMFETGLKRDAPKRKVQVARMCHAGFKVSSSPSIAREGAAEGMAQGPPNLAPLAPHGNPVTVSAAVSDSAKAGFPRPAGMNGRDKAADDQMIAAGGYFWVSLK
jgi:hypothetical protein